ncbi:phage integrase N-terminal SAM-like domain-containing protein [Colwelliaceae bacterium MEBiC 14330]
MKHYSIHTEESYLLCIKRSILFNQKRHPKVIGEEEITYYISYLAVDIRVTPSTQN